MTPEGRVKARLRAFLKECPVPVYLFMPVQNGMGDATLDFIGCVGGRFFAVETKAGNGDMTLRQCATRARMIAAGGAVFLLNENPQTWEFFKGWLMSAAAMVALEQGETPVPPPPEWVLNILNDQIGERDGNSTES